MATKIPKIERPNMRAIGGMADDDLIKVREYYLRVMAKARGLKDPDTLDAAIDWVIALCDEMGNRGKALRSGSKTAGGIFIP